MREDSVTLIVPARGEHAKLVRLAAAELAARLGMSYDEVDDVRIAAEEAFVYAGRYVGEQGELTFVFNSSPDLLEIEVGPLPEEAALGGMTGVSEGYAEFILRSVCDEFALERSSDGCTLRLCRRAGASAGGSRA